MVLHGGLCLCFRASSPDTKSEKSSATQLTNLSSATMATSMAYRGRKKANKNAPEAFLSIQLEKVGISLRKADKLVLVSPASLQEAVSSIILRAALDFGAKTTFRLIVASDAVSRLDAERVHQEEDGSGQCAAQRRQNGRGQEVTWLAMYIYS